MTKTLEEIHRELIQIANEFDDECSQAEKVGCNIEFSFGPFVNVHIDLLRELRQFTEGDRNDP